MNREKKSENSSHVASEAVPLFGNWRNAYLAVVICFVLDVALFYAFGRYFS